MLRYLLLAALLCVPLPAAADSIMWTNDGGDGWDDSVDSIGEEDMDTIKTEVDDNDSRLDNLGDCSSSPCDLTAGTLLNGAAIQTGADDDQPDDDSEVPDAITVGASGSVNDAALNSTVTLDAEWDSVAKIETATGADIVTSTETFSMTTGTASASGSCTVGDMYLETDVPTLSCCTSTDTWEACN